MSHPYDVLDIPGHAGRLMFTPCPGTKGTGVSEALTTIDIAGAQVLITLMPNAELAANQADDLPARCAELGMEWLQLPVADEQVPLADFDTAWHRHRETILARLAEGATLAIHCKGGSGRTGLIAARILIELGMPRETAVKKVQALRPKAIQHPAHVGWLAQFGDCPLMLKTFGLFFITALAEIVGCYLPYLWLRQGKSAWLLIPAAASLMLFAWLLSLHPTAAGRVYAAYGGVYIGAAIVWLWLVDGIRPTGWDLLGSAVALVGMAIIMFAPRGACLTEINHDAQNWSQRFRPDRPSGPTRGLGLAGAGIHPDQRSRRGRSHSRPPAEFRLGAWPLAARSEQRRQLHCCGWQTNPGHC